MKYFSFLKVLFQRVIAHCSNGIVIYVRLMPPGIQRRDVPDWWRQERASLRSLHTIKVITLVAKILFLLSSSSNVASGK